MLGGIAFILGLGGLFTSACISGHENRQASSGINYGIPVEYDQDVSAQVRAVRNKWYGVLMNQRREVWNQLGGKFDWPEQRKKIWWRHVYEDEGVPVSEGYLNNISGWHSRYYFEYVMKKPNRR